MIRMKRIRYMPRIQRPNFQWTSDPVEPRPGGEDQVHFTSFKLNDLNIRVGDYVLVRNSDDKDLKDVS